MSAESVLETLAQSSNQESPALREKRNALRQNSDIYAVQTGDTIASIAQKH